jgi:hypothetical protein
VRAAADLVILTIRSNLLNFRGELALPGGFVRKDESMEDEFTLTELRRVCEIIWGYELDPRAFKRKITKIEGFVEPTGTKQMHGTGRPAELYRAGKAERLFPPIRPPGVNH